MNRKKASVLYTDHLCMCGILEKDVEDLAELLADREIAQTFMVPEFASVHEARPLAKRLMDLCDSEEHFVYGIYLEEKLIGFINHVDKNETDIELGYVIHPSRKNNGFATQALSAAIAELFDMGYETVKAGAFEENPASMRVMEKCGMVRTYQDEDIAYRGKEHHCINYAIRKRELL